MKVATLKVATLKVQSDNCIIFYIKPENLAKKKIQSKIVSGLSLHESNVARYKVKAGSSQSTSNGRCDRRHPRYPRIQA